MSETDQPQPSQPPPPMPTEQGLAPEAEKALFAEKFKDFLAALEALYIRGNISGRNHFRADWPQGAAHVLGPELVKYDEEGTDDKDHRSKMEGEAEERRLALVEILVEVEEKSAHAGAMDLEYIEGVVKPLGRKLALYVYDQGVVDRIIPPVPGEDDKEEGQEDNEQNAAPPSPPQEEEIAPPVPEPVPLDDVKPIDVSQPPKPPAAPSPTAGSGLNLGAKRNVVQVDFVEKGRLSYDKLVAASAGQEAPPENIVPRPDIEIAIDPPVPMTQAPPQQEQSPAGPPDATGQFAVPTKPNAPPVTEIFNAHAKNA